MANVTLNVTDNQGNATGTVEAPAEIFGFSAEEVQSRIPLIHQVVVAQRAAARQGTHATKTRGMVSGGGRKPWKQKGTGRARQGSIRAPQWYHGGTVFGPQPRDYSQRTPKKMKAAALKTCFPIVPMPVTWPLSTSVFPKPRPPRPPLPLLPR